MLTVERVDYHIDWKAFKRGSSFFVPCLDCIRARKRISDTLRRYKFQHVMKIKIEDGVRGLRIWRV